MFMDKRIIISGANGFIGSNIVFELLASSSPVTAIVQRTSNTENLKRIKCYNILSTDNYLDPAIIRKLSISKPEHFIHCAWNENHIKNTQNLIQAIELAKILKCKTFITLGTYQEYGCEKKELSESLVCNPKTSFGKIKFSYYLLCKSICEDLEMKHCHVRLSQPYSAKDYDEFYYTKIIKALSRGDKPLLENPFDAIDYIHASDIARGIIALMKNNCEGAFNLGFGEAVQNKILLNMIYEEFNKKIRYDINQDEEKKKSVCFSLDNKKIYTSTSWKPSISIWDGISMLVNENKFNSKASLTEFTNRIRKLYK